MNKRGTIWFVLSDGGRTRILQRRSSDHRHFETVADEKSAELQVPSHDLVNQAAAQGLFDTLILVAPPRVLSDMRQALTAQAKERVIVEEGKDLLNLPEQMLTRRLTALLRR